VGVAVADEEAVRTVAPSRVGRKRRLHFLRARARCIVVPRALTRDLSNDVPHFNDNTGVRRPAPLHWPSCSLAQPLAAAHPVNDFRRLRATARAGVV
jgi:hypothetical protein